MDEGQAEIIAAIRALGDQLSAVITDGFAGVGQKIDRLEQSFTRELRILNRSVENVGRLVSVGDANILDRLDGIDDKLSDIREHVLRVEDRQAI